MPSDADRVPSDPQAEDHMAVEARKPIADDREDVWTYRGYHLQPGEFNTAMVHLFRAEVSRANVWRQRLDTTTNWAVITTAAAISFAFTNEIRYHAVIILNALLVTLFLIIEARRYRYYGLWSYRVRLLETDFFAAMLVPPFRPQPDWAENMAATLRHPRFPITMRQAVTRRLRSNFVWIYLVLGLTWVLKLSLYPTGAASLDEFVSRAHIGVVSGWIVVAGMALTGIVLAVVVLTTSDPEQETGSVFPC